MKKETWVITENDEFYYSGFHQNKDGVSLDFTPLIDQAYLFTSKKTAKGLLQVITSGSDYKDSRGHVTPTTAFGMRRLTRKDYNEIKKRQEGKAA